MIRYAASAAPGFGGALLVLAHGAGAGERHPFMVKVATGLARRGVDVVTFEFPYMREKRRAPDRAPVLEAAFREAIAEAQRDGAGAGRLFIGGKSMGGRIATHLAAQQHERVTGVVALGYPLHPPGKPERTRDAHLSSIDVPVLIVQGERDAFGTPGELAPALARMRARVTLHVVPEGDHSLTVPRSGGIGQEAIYETALDAIVEWMGGLEPRA